MANSTITLSALGLPQGEPIRIPMGTDLRVVVNNEPDELLGRGLRLKPTAGNFSPYFRTVSPENPRAEHSYGLSSSLYLEPGSITSFNFNTLNIVPGIYELVTLRYNSDNSVYQNEVDQSLEFIRSNQFEIVAGIGDDLVPQVSVFNTANDLLTAVINDITTEDGAVMKLYDMNAQPVNSVHTGDFLVLAINTVGMTEVQNRVLFELDKGDGTPLFNFFEVFAFSEFVDLEDFAVIADLPNTALNQNVRYKIFYVPTHQEYTAQTGTLTVSMAYKTPANNSVSFNINLTDDPVLQLGDNPVVLGEERPVPLHTRKVVIAAIGADYPAAHFEAFAQDVQDYFFFASRGYFAVDVDIQVYRLEDLDIDYASWWNDLPKNPDGEPLDPTNPDDLFYIRLIYARQNNVANLPTLKGLHPLQKDGEDITIYLTLNIGAGGGGGSGIHAHEVNVQWSHNIITSTYLMDGGYAAPTTLNDPATIWDVQEKRASLINITCHEIGHVYWKRSIRQSCGHANMYNLTERLGEGRGADRRNYNFLRYLLSNTSRRALGWGDTLMSYTRNRRQLDQHILSDQLGRFVRMYAPPELNFLVKRPQDAFIDAQDTITVNAGEEVEFVLIGASASGLRMMWYFQQGNNAVKTMYRYGDLDSYNRKLEAIEFDTHTFDSPGEYVMQANCRDILYYLEHGGKGSNADTRGNPHQASENGGLREVRVTVL